MILLILKIPLLKKGVVRGDLKRTIFYYNHTLKNTSENFKKT